MRGILNGRDFIFKRKSNKSQLTFFSIVVQKIRPNGYFLATKGNHHRLPEELILTRRFYQHSVTSITNEKSNKR